MANDMTHLDNPVWSALTSGNSNLAMGNNVAKHYPPKVSPFAGVAEYTTGNFRALADQYATGGRAFIFSTHTALQSAGWKGIMRVEGYQMVYKGVIPQPAAANRFIPLTEKDVPAMLELTRLNPPGPFLEQTIAFGGYEGIFIDGRLVAMAGRRFHSGRFVEISAVCTHPDYTGHGYARELINSQIRQLDAAGNASYLHVRSDNTRAIDIYKRMGFEIRTDIYIHVLEKE